MRSDRNADEVISLDLSSWKRREHFDFFRQFEQPFFNICSELDVTGLLEFTRDKRCSFFLASLYLSLRAANEIEAFRLRIKADEVLQYPVINAGSTILRDDETFGFGYFNFSDDFAQFEAQGRAELAEVASPSSIRPDIGRDDLIYYSVLPWISFTSFAHASRCPATDCIPRIVFGKHHCRDGRHQMLPISIEVHHALVDGLHVGRFLERFQALSNEPAAALNCDAHNNV